MWQAKYFLLFGAVVIYLVVTIGAIRKINRTIVLSPKQKKINYVLVVLIPFLWAVFLRGALKVTPGSHEAPDEIWIETHLEHGPDAGQW